MREPLNLPENAEAIIDKMLEADKYELYTLLGESLGFEEPGQPLPTEPRNYKSIASEGLSIIGSHLSPAQGSTQRLMPGEWSTTLRTRMEKGKRLLEESQEKLHQKICIEINACKLEKDTLTDNRTLFGLLLPAVASAVGAAIPAAAIATVTIIVMKWGIESYCNCSKDN
jgi:hypothetical protein